MDNTQIRHIFFDLDHTLWDFERNSAATFELLFEMHKLPLDLKEFLDIYVPANKVYWKLYREGKIGKEQLRYARLSEVFTKCNFKASDRLIREMADGYIEHLSSFTHVFDHTHHVLEYLSKDYPLHILTNGFAEIQSKKLQGAGLADFFDLVINAEDVGYKKPDPQIFSIATSRLGALPNEVIHIGDDLEADIIGARNSGWNAIHFDKEGEFNHKHCPIVNCLSEIKKYL